jgi:hypothetical protein
MVIVYSKVEELELIMLEQQNISNFRLIKVIGMVNSIMVFVSSKVEELELIMLEQRNISNLPPTRKTDGSLLDIAGRSHSSPHGSFACPSQWFTTTSPQIWALHG